MSYLLQLHCMRPRANTSLIAFLVACVLLAALFRSRDTGSTRSEDGGSPLIARGGAILNKTLAVAVAATPSKVASAAAPAFAAAPTYRPFVYVPLDTDYIDANFDKLKATVSKSPIGKFRANVSQMLIRRRLDMDTSNWLFHTPSGRNLRVAELQEATRDKDYPVPNLAHYILPFQDPKLDFHHYICILSGIWIMKPIKVFFWYVNPPRGQYWDLLRINMTAEKWEHKVVMVQRPVINKVYNITVKVKEHQADLMRIEAVLVLGGAYFDLDVITLNPMEPLRKFPFSIGKELPTVLCNGVFLATANNTLLAMWHLAYQAFDDSSWGGHSLFLIGDLCKAFPTFCHIEEDSLDRPGWIDFGKIFGPGDRSWNWQKKNYAMHLYYRLHATQYDLKTIRTVNHAFGDMARYVLFGRKEPFRNWFGIQF